MTGASGRSRAGPLPKGGRGDLLSAVLGGAGLPMVVTDPRRADNPVVFANDAFCGMTGYPPHEVIGRNCRFMRGTDTNPDAVDAIRSAVRERRKATVEIVNHRRDGTPLWNAVFLSPVFGAGGEPTHFFGALLDVTRLRAADAARQHARTMLAVGELTSGVAHDFNNLLTVVAGNVEMLDRPAVPEDRRHRLAARVRHAVARAQRLTGQLLAFARRQHLAPRRVDLNALLLAAEGGARRALGPRIRLVLRLDPSLERCVADPEQVEAALTNLLLNARDAMPCGGTVAVATGRVRLGPDAPEVAAGEVPAGGYACLFVDDDGAGMPPHVLDRAADPFFTTKDNAPGSGLGLSSVYGFAQQSRGHLLLRSTPGRGTSARLLFPCSDAGDENGR